MVALDGPSSASIPAEPMNEQSSESLASPAHQSPAVVAATMLIGTAAMLVMGVEPILLGGLLASGRLTEAGVGQAAMLEIIGLAAGATFGPFLMNRGHMRMKVAVVSTLLFVLNLAIHWAAAPGLVLLQRGLAGVLEGFLLGAVSVVFTHNDRPERMSGLLLGLSTIPQVAAAYLLPILVIPRFGIDAGFALLSAAALIAGLATPYLVDRVEPSPDTPHVHPVASPALFLVVAAAFLQNAGIGAAWSYLELLASQHQFSSGTVGSAIAASLACQVGGALAASWLSGRLHAGAVLVAGAAVQAGIVTVLLYATRADTFLLAACGFGVFWLAMQPFLVARLVALDPSRIVAMLLAPVALVGFSAGPLAASLVIAPGDVEGAYRLGAALLVACGALYFLHHFVRRAGQSISRANLASLPTSNE